MKSENNFELKTKVSNKFKNTNILNCKYIAKDKVLIRCHDEASKLAILNKTESDEPNFCSV